MDDIFLRLCRAAVVAAVFSGTPPAFASSEGAVFERLSADLKRATLDDLERLAIDLRAGDVIVAWSRHGAAGPVRSPFDLRRIALEQLPRGGLRLRVQRDAEWREVDIPIAAWPLEIEARPLLAPARLEAYEAGRRLIVDQKADEGLAVWRRAAADGSSDACWLLSRIAATLASARRKEESRAAHAEALSCAGADRPALAVAQHEDYAWRAQELTWHDLAEESFAAAEAAAPRADAPLVQAEELWAIGDARYLEGRHDEAIATYRRALAIQERELPRGLPTARTLNYLALCHLVQGELDVAEQTFQRAEEMAAQAAAGSHTHRMAIRCQGLVSMHRGQFADAERSWRRDIALSRRGERASYEGLGALALERGDLDAAESWTQRAIALGKEIGAPRWAFIKSVSTLGRIALARGDLDAAEEFLRQSLAESEIVATDPFAAVVTHTALGRIALLRSDRSNARRCFERAVTESERASARVAGIDALLALGQMARTDGDWPVAKEIYERAREITAGLGAVGLHTARILHGRGAVEHALGRRAEAAALWSDAVEAVEAQRGSVGGSDEARSLYASRFFGIYHDHAALLTRLGRAADAYHVVEKARARSLLALMAERDLVLEDEIPPALERQRRRVDADYRRAHEALMRLDHSKGGAKARTLAQRMTELREEQVRIAGEVRAASPRIAAARYPQPLDPSQVEARLDPGVLLLAYSVGPQGTLLFAVGNGGPVEVAEIAAGEAALEHRIQRWRGEVELAAPGPPFHREARALYDLLLRPMERRLRVARRLLISPDGPLHALPFAALRERGRYLAESKPIAIVPSGTVQGQWARTRREGWPASRLVAFADPRRPAAGLTRLPQSRREVDDLARLFPGGAAYVGEEATEERARKPGADARYVHFACHALVDERIPLDSGLVLHTQGESGLLQAWEIYQHVRIDADLVTLSACRSGSGAARAGEGLLGLTRAFQYAGARTVLASLWDVGDASSRWFMARLYRDLARGIAKDDALQRTQRAAIRAGHDPMRWAAYQLYGDWR